MVHSLNASAKLSSPPKIAMRNSKWRDKILFGHVDFVSKLINQRKFTFLKTIINLYCKKTVTACLFLVKRGFLPPILIFLIDLSGSMAESISVVYDD